MKKHLLEDLKQQPVASVDLYLNYGFKIVEKGQVLIPSLFQNLESRGVDFLVEVDEFELDSFCIKKQFKAVKLSALMEIEGELQKNLYDVKGVKRFHAGTQWTDEIRKELKRDNVEILYSKRALNEIITVHKAARELIDSYQRDLKSLN